MDGANLYNGMVIGTGDLSELALGWATYNGDHMSMYGVNASIPKTLVRHLVHWVAMQEMDDTCRETLLDIIDTPISPELIPADENGEIQQKTEDLVGPYELHDFFLYHFIQNGYSPQNPLRCGNSVRRTLRPGDDPALDAGILPAILLAAVQNARPCPTVRKLASLSLSPRATGACLRTLRQACGCGKSIF